MIIYISLKLEYQHTSFELDFNKILNFLVKVDNNSIIILLALTKLNFFKKFFCLNINYLIYIIYIIIINNRYEYFDFNLKLINGLFLIHPIIIYIYYSVLIYIYINLYKYIFFKKLFLLNQDYFIFYKNNNVRIKSLLHIALKFIVTAVILGAWWAFQELDWGSWWNWDMIEIINLYFILINIKILHLNINIFYKYAYKIIYFLNNVLFLFILVRYNLIQSIHSFIDNEITTQYKYILVYLFLIKINCISSIKLYKYFLCTYTFKKTWQYINANIFNENIHLLVYIYISNSILINYINNQYYNYILEVIIQYGIFFLFLKNFFFSFKKIYVYSLLSIISIDYIHIYIINIFKFKKYVLQHYIYILVLVVLFSNIKLYSISHYLNSNYYYYNTYISDTKFINFNFKIYSKEYYFNTFNENILINRNNSNIYLYFNNQINLIKNTLTYWLEIKNNFFIKYYYLYINIFYLVFFKHLLIKIFYFFKNISKIAY